MKITVYAASSGQLGQAYIDNAQALGRLLAAKGYTLINGAGRMGLMGASCDACIAAGGEALGIIPRFMVEQGWQHPSQPLLITADMHERKEKLAEEAILLAETTPLWDKRVQKFAALT